MMKFKLLLWMLTKLMQRAVKNNPKCAAFVKDKNVIFQIQTASGEGRYFEVKNGKINSYSGLTKSPSFTFTFKTGSKGFAVLSAKDSVNTFLTALKTQDLVITGNFVDVMWFQSLVDFIQPHSKPSLTV
ncbi:helicase [Acinetobacter sp. WU_MDCI_Abxb74]|uniref:helicase n=1 Tax=Acinetobacter sp. WU_MDCI_Abxb74 TaxID=2850072 RepID=UPI0021CDE445|nr:helicase [Acinetobacter sp. WU_MDCI_Abxb74]MCU4423416.1 helicase [Acinetobacter sp. WU_MDCI_Abxb74]